MAYDPESIRSLRTEKDQYFKLAHDSPIPHEYRDAFHGLNYFAYDTNFRVRAKFTRYESPAAISMITSKVTTSEYSRYGYFEFEFNEKKHKLHAYKQTHGEGGHEGTLFVPFRDKTSGKESYAAARYLDIMELPGTDYVLDFNLAYNPYCAYSDYYICPFPPAENSLDLEVRAGEKKFKD